MKEGAPGKPELLRFEVTNKVRFRKNLSESLRKTFEEIYGKIDDQTFTVTEVKRGKEGKDSVTLGPNEMTESSLEKYKRRKEGDPRWEGFSVSNAHLEFAPN